MSRVTEEKWKKGKIKNRNNKYKEYNNKASD